MNESDPRPGVTLRRATAGEIAAYVSRAVRHYAAERERAGDDAPTARARAEASFAELFPDGLPAPGHLVLRVEHGGRDAGMLWIGPRDAGTFDRWWVWDIVIDEAFRGRGIGRATMLLAEQRARANGAVELGLNVFGHNRVATGLYRSLGYEVTAMQMRKAL